MPDGSEVGAVLTGLIEVEPGHVGCWNYLDPRFPERVIRVERYTSPRLPKEVDAGSYQYYLKPNHLHGSLWVQGDLLDMVAACATMIERASGFAGDQS